MWNELTMLLKAQLTLCQQLLTLGEQQRRSLIDGNTQRFGAIGREQEIVFSQFRKLETKKQEFLTQRQARHPQSDLQQVEVIIALAEEAEQTQLRDCFAQLLPAMQQLRADNQQNQQLLENTMRFIDFNINIMTQTTADDVYAPKGQGGSVISKKKMFDQTI